MGIVRYAVECPGCKVGLTLRLAVGLDERQSFFIVCPKCSAATRGALLWRGGIQTELEISDGRLLDTYRDCQFTININPEYPSVPDAARLNQPGGSAFLMFVSLLGPDRMAAFQRATHQLRSVIANDWAALQRLTTYYLKRDWAHFDSTLEGLIPSEAPRPTQEWHRDDAIHKLYDYLLGPLWVLDEERLYLEMKLAWNSLWDPSCANLAAMIAFAKAEVETQLFRDVQRDLFSNIERYVGQVSALLPGLLCNILPPQHQAKVDEFRLFRDEFELLRDLYIQTFESCHKALRWVIGVANIEAHGNPDVFAAPPTAPELAKKIPKNLAAFGKLVSADKRKWLAVLPEWEQRWDVVFDRHIRNDIGHASAHHELATGLILRENRPPLPYTRFVARMQRSIHGLLATASALKILRFYAAD